MKSSISRAVIFVLAGWPLLMPNGICICQVAHVAACDHGDITPADCEDEGHEECVEHCCVPGLPASCPCEEHQRPSDDQHSSSCPAKSSERWKLSERPSSPVFVVTAALPVSSDLAACPSPSILVDTSHAPDVPTYLAFCTLQI